MAGSIIMAGQHYDDYYGEYMNALDQPQGPLLVPQTGLLTTQTIILAEGVKLVSKGSFS